MNKWVYSFDEGDKSLKMLLGGKGANLCEMTKLGLPVPFGFILSTEVCEFYNKNNRSYPETLSSQLDMYLEKLETKMGRKFGDPDNPLLVSVRSGAAASMPGMMDTVLNLGLNETILQGWIKKTGNARLCYDAYRRFLQMFGDVVLELPHEGFEHALESLKKKHGLKLDIEMTESHLQELIEMYKKVYTDNQKTPPENPKEQLWMAIEAVFKSWDNPRAKKYRELNDIKGLIGTAVNVQSMVFGNMNDRSATGVAFTRNPSTGEHRFFGEYLINAQGEDVVAGIRTPNDIGEMNNTFPKVYAELMEMQALLEKNYKDMQDIEFTIMEEKLYLLQTRNGKRTAESAVRIAVEMVSEGLIDKKTALQRIEPKQLDQLLHPRFDPKAQNLVTPIAKGLPASPGAATGKLVFNAEAAVDWFHRGETVILARLETSPEDIEGMHVSAGILTARGGMTSHAAVVARGMGRCCVSGCGEVHINEKEKTLRVGDLTLKEGDWVSLDGSKGEVYKDALEMIEPELSGNFGTIMQWADEFRKLKVRTNADTPEDAKIAFDFGAEGIGLCRTEHMFFQEERIKYMRMMILAKTEADREKALEKILPYQRGDFEELFRAMKGYPVIIRTLDPPLHEFLPHKKEDIMVLAEEMGISNDDVKERIKMLHEFNPMLGHRGCRLGITMPEITRMQARALVEAAYNVQKEGTNVKAEIMIPLVGKVEELRNQKKIVQDIIEETKHKFSENSPHILIGTMIEVPRAAITANEIAQEAEFFSFGTNDLTQMSCGFSRDDSGEFLKSYIEKGIYEYDPFQSIDQTGVGELMKIAVAKGKSVNSSLEIGICGEHGGDPESVKFCHRIGLDYVSCSPYRVPIARLAAAQAAIEEG